MPARTAGVVVITTGRLIPRKRVAWAIDAIADLRRRGEDVSLWVVGDGPDREELNRRAQERAVESHVRFWGTRSDLHRILPVADIMLHCASSEGLPNSVQEGMAAGLPIVAGKTSGIPEIITDGEEGIFFPVNDYGACVQALSRIVEDEEKRISMGRNARHRAETCFRPKVMAAALEDFYEEVLSNWK